MTNTPSPDEDRELIDGPLRAWQNGDMDAAGTIEDLVNAADRFLSDRAKLARRVRMLANHGNCLCAECKDLDALNRSTDRAT